MRIVLRRSSRVPRPPLWVVAILVLWISGVAAMHLLRPDFGLCYFKRATDLPCPTCGSTRAGMAMLSGELLTALLYNPLLVMAGMVVAGVLAGRLIFACQLTVEASRRGWIVLTLSVVGLVLANWVYLLLRGL